MRALQYIIGRWLGAGVSLLLLVGAFFSSQDEVFATATVGLWLLVVVVATVAVALLLPEVAGAMTFITRLTAVGAAAVAFIQGGWGVGAALVLVAVVMWGAYWIAGRRAAGRSIGGVFRDVRYQVEDVTKP